MKRRTVFAPVPTCTGTRASAMSSATAGCQVGLANATRCQPRIVRAQEGPSASSYG